MQCAQCGAYLPRNKRFCADCGTPVPDPDITRVTHNRPSASYQTPRPVVLPTTPDAQSPVIGYAANDVDTPERLIFTVRPTLLFVQVGYVIAAFTSLLLAVLLTWLPPVLFGIKETPWYVWLPLSLAVFYKPIAHHIRRNRVRYTLTETKIEIEEGFLAKTTRNIPLGKIQDITVTASLLQRLLGYGDVVLDNASEQNGKILLNDIPDPRRHADLLLRQLRRR